MSEKSGTYYTGNHPSIESNLAPVNGHTNGGVSSTAGVYCSILGDQVEQISNFKVTEPLQPILGHIHAAFVSRLFSDTTLLIEHFPPIHCHALILSRSPYLRNALLHRQPVQHTTNLIQSLHLSNNDPLVTPEAIHIALEYLYTSKISSEDISNIVFSLIATFSLLGIFSSDLGAWIEEKIVSTYINPTNLKYILSFLKSKDTRNLGPYPFFNGGFHDKIVHFLVFTAPNLPFDCSNLHTSTKEDGSCTKTGIAIDNNGLIELYTPMSFALLKETLEHKALPVRTNHIRYQFAKEVVTGRKLLQPTNAPLLSEELVVLAFGGGKQICRNY